MPAEQDQNACYKADSDDQSSPGQADLGVDLEVFEYEIAAGIPSGTGDRLLGASTTQ